MVQGGYSIDHCVASNHCFATCKLLNLFINMVLFRFYLILSSFFLLSPVAFADSIWDPIIQKVHAQYPEIPNAALTKAFGYLEKNSASVSNQNFISIIDFTQASTERRYYLIDLKTGDATNYLVAHGKESGENFATRFSNTPDSNMSSLGIYLTGEEYWGGRGFSMVLKGMETTNSNAEVREIIMHSADYVSDEFIARYGRLGRSLGCPAVNPLVVGHLIRKIENGSVLLIHGKASTGTAD